jgi:hypothetical protein
MRTLNQTIVAHPQGEQPTVEVHSAIADTFAGRIHVEWDAAAPVTPFGQLPFFIDYLKQVGLFDAWVAYSASISLSGRIAWPEMLPGADPSPHLTWLL